GGTGARGRRGRRRRGGVRGHLRRPPHRLPGHVTGPDHRRGQPGLSGPARPHARRPDRPVRLRRLPAGARDAGRHRRQPAAAVVRACARHRDARPHAAVPVRGGGPGDRPPRPAGLVADQRAGHGRRRPHAAGAPARGGR
ncbi:MAG: FIG00511110: hypothetical protein, partial [uncultured Friedmanniella sp.]